MMNEEDIILLRIGKAILSRRKELKMTQEDLAFNADIDRTYIGYIENGKQNVSISVLCKIANVLEMDVKDFFNYEL